MEAGAAARMTGMEAGSGADPALGATRERGWTRSDDGDERNQTVEMEVGAWLCLVYTIVLRISRDLPICIYPVSYHISTSSLGKRLTVCQAKRP
jgi:hypothetical protein